MTDLLRKLVLTGVVAASLTPAVAMADERDWRRDDRRYEEACRYDARYCDNRGYDYRDDRRPQNYRGAGVQRLSNLLQRDDQLVDWAFANFDRNRDGRLDGREANDANKSFFYLADRNRSGYIEGREFDRARDYALRDMRYAYGYRR